MKQENESRLLPITEYHGVQYLVDIENRQFRKFPNGQVRIPFRSEQGQAMVKAMLGEEWRSYGLVKKDAKITDGMGHCPQCGQEMPLAEG
jgi:hypothetical protein